MSRSIDAYVQHKQWRLATWGFAVAGGLWTVGAILGLYVQSRFAILSFLVAIWCVILALGYHKHLKLIPAKAWFEEDRLRIRTVDPCWKRLAFISRNLKLKVISAEQDEDAVIVIGAGRWGSLGENYRIWLKPGTEGMAELRAKLGDVKQAR